MSELTPLSVEECRKAAEGIEDAVEHCIHLPSLPSGRCRAYARGDAVIVDALYMPGEPMGFGRDVEGMADILGEMKGWSVVEVPPGIADSLAKKLEKRLGCGIGRLADIYHTLSEIPLGMAHAQVRLLGSADAELYAASAPAFGDEPGEARRVLHEGIVAGAIMEGRVVAAVEGYPATRRFVNLCVETLEPYRKRGFAAACSACVIEEVLRRKQTPVWSTSAINWASLATAKKLGFRKFSEMMYLIPDRPVGE